MRKAGPCKSMVRPFYRKMPTEAGMLRSITAAGRHRELRRGLLHALRRGARCWPPREPRPPRRLRRTARRWERRLLARIHRLTVGMLRKQIEPVTAAAFWRWLMRWQHVAPGTQVVGERGTLEVL